MGRVVLDSSVVLALFDEQDAHHTAAAAAVTQRRAADDQFVLPAVVLAEVLVGVAWHSPGTMAHRRQQLAAAFGPVRVIDADVAERAARLRAAHTSLRMPDALVLAVASVDGAVTLTCDAAFPRCQKRVVLVP